MTIVHYITHPDVVIDPAVPVQDWPLSDRGRARMRAALAAPWVAGIAAVHCSTERKAIDGADILAGHLGCGFGLHPDLRENDRSATGFLPRAAFEATADLFFAHPTESIRGWERAIDAQARVVAAVERVLSLPLRGDVAIVAHGGVGALLLCALLGEPISRRRDQPQTAAGGFRFAFDAATSGVLHGWQRIDA
ncbi:MAG: histidine phosphatase family protein [Acetobacteraceae bacterium]|nr:histidine phosphatase family protein [Acetobacteraceae bacterium]